MTNESNNQHTVAPLQPGNNAVHEQQVNDGRVDVSTLSISQDGINFIADFEKHSLEAYNDSENFCTIGVGHLIARSSCEDIRSSDEFIRLHDNDVYANNITKGEILNGITEQKQTDMFRENLTTAENYVRNHVTVRLHQQEFDALVSLVYNTGSLAGAPNLRRELNSSNYQGAAHEFLDITNGGTHGLVIRRGAEVNMFNNNVYDSRH